MNIVRFFIAHSFGIDVAGVQTVLEQKRLNALGANQYDEPLVVAEPPTIFDVYKRQLRDRWNDSYRYHLKVSSCRLKEDYQLEPEALAPVPFTKQTERVLSYRVRNDVRRTARNSQRLAWMRD